MNIELFATNIGHTVSILITISLVILVLSRGRRKRTGIVFACLITATVIWELSYIIGINISDPNFSRTAFMFNLITILIVTINAHFVLLVTKRYERQKKVLAGLYGISVLLILFFVIFPDFFLLMSEPKFSLPNFFVPGKYYFVSDIFFFGALFYSLYHLSSAYKNGDFDMKNRLKYLALSMVIAYGIGSVPLLLLYGINVNPLISMIFGLYAIPMAYSIVEYKIIDINIVAKKAFWYALGVAGVAILITIISNANNAILAVFPGFPGWTVPTISGIIAVSTAIIVWEKMREADILKDEFINIVMHKFRTPLTYIKWSVESLKTSGVTEDQKKELDTIEGEGVALVGLTNTLVNLANVGNKENAYSFTEEDLPSIAEKILRNKKSRIEMKRIHVSTNYADNLPTLRIDGRRMEFAIETIVDNAITYTPENGSVYIDIRKDENHLTFSAKDSGTGISKEDLSRLFNKFFRGAGAKTDTEGMGIGLFITKDIVEKHGGKIWAESEGLGKGSTFIFTIPIR